MARKWSSRARLRLAGVLLLLGIVGLAFAWWHMRHWRPDPATFRMQGAEIGAEDGAIRWRTLKATGAQFVYLDASASAFARDSAFTASLEGARAAGLRVGAVHRYDPCQPADKQAANFVTVVPRDPALLPPVVELDRTADDCPMRVRDAAVESELTTFLNQIETHTGKPALLKLSKQFEQRYHLAASVDRNLWLTRNRFEPDYAGRPWTMWTANSGLVSVAGEEPLRWIVVQP